MYKILEKTQFSEKVFKFRIEAPEHGEARTRWPVPHGSRQRDR